MGETTAAGVRCPQCSAALRPGAPWCTQCYARVGAPAQVAAQQSPPVPQRAVGLVERAAPSTGSWPCSTCAQPNELAEPACTGCGTPFLAAVREQRPSLVLPVVGDLVALSPARRAGVAVCVVLVLLLVSALLALLLA